jgi:hypothetical protein
MSRWNQLIGMESQAEREEAALEPARRSGQPSPPMTSHRIGPSRSKPGTGRNKRSTCTPPSRISASSRPQNASSSRATSRSRKGGDDYAEDTSEHARQLVKDAEAEHPAPDTEDDSGRLAASESVEVARLGAGPPPPIGGMVCRPRWKGRVLFSALSISAAASDRLRRKLIPSTSGRGSTQKKYTYRQRR